VHRRLIAAVLGIAVVATTATAAPTPEQEQEAERLFDEGRALFDAGRVAEACPYFEKSQELDPGRGTLINLAACYEAVGRLLMALKVFREVETQSVAAKDQPRLDASRKRIAAIEARIPHVTITYAGTLEIQVDVQGQVVGRDQWPDILVDPGEVRVRASAEGYLPWETKVTVFGDGKRTTIEIPDFAAPPPPGDGDGNVTPPPVTAGEPGRRRNRPRVIAGIATLAAGTLAFGGSVVLALGAKSDYDDALADHCGGRANGCDAEGVRLTGDARSRGNVATIVGGVGLLAAAGGLVLWLTAPTETSVETRVVPQVTPDGAGVSLVGRF
jgi:hypothetical protein